MPRQNLPEPTQRFSPDPLPTYQQVPPPSVSQPPQESHRVSFAPELNQCHLTIGEVLEGPVTYDSGISNALSAPQLMPQDHPLPINLATALRLSDVRPLVIAVAQAKVQIAAAQAEHANVLWLPTAVAGADYIRHSGGIQETNGDLSTANTSSLTAGGSAQLKFATTDAIFEPLVARKILEARRIDTQAARNEALMTTANAYFDVQKSRGTYAAMSDAKAKADDLVFRIQSLAKGLVAPDEVNRAQTLQAELAQATETALQRWRVSSANLTRIIRLDPSAVVEPLEPDHLQIRLIAPEIAVDDLIIIGLHNRPELASQQQLVQATLVALKREKMRPLIPSVLITGNGTPDNYFQGAAFGTGGDNLDQWAGRSDVSAQLIWQAENLGFGNQARIREQKGYARLATVELFQLQDDIAAQVTQAKADVDSATARVAQAETGLRQGLISYAGNIEGLAQTQRFGDVLVLINRPQEVVAALQQLQTAFVDYYATVADFNRAQFRLFYAMGVPSEELSLARPTGPIQPVDTYRGPALPNVTFNR